MAYAVFGAHAGLPECHAQVVRDNDRVVDEPRVALGFLGDSAAARAVRDEEDRSIRRVVLSSRDAQRR